VGERCIKTALLIWGVSLPGSCLESKTRLLTYLWGNVFNLGIFITVLAFDNKGLIEIVCKGIESYLCDYC
jgi:hypothetical protein